MRKVVYECDGCGQESYDDYAFGVLELLLNESRRDTKHETFYFCVSCMRDALDKSARELLE